MKFVLMCALGLLVGCKSDFQREIEHAFIRFDRNNDGFVTELQIMEAVASDVSDSGQFAEMKNMVKKMMDEFDETGDGLDFAELYRASGGKLEDL